MSEENVEAARQLVEAFNRRDLAGMTDGFNPEIEWMPVGPAAVERSVYRGRTRSRTGLPRPGRPGRYSASTSTRPVIWVTRFDGWAAPP